MWARLNSDNEIAQLYTRPIGITLDGVQYPASIFTLWSDGELQTLNIWSITMTNSAENPVWYDVSSPDYAVTKDDDDNVSSVTGTYTNTAKPMEDVYAIPVASSDGLSAGNKIASSATYSSAAKQGTIISKGDNVLNVEITKGTWAKGNTVRGFNSDGTALSPAVSSTISDSLTLHSRGKKWTRIQEVKDIQSSKLQDHDWYYIRKTDAGTAVPSEIQTYRNSVRTKASDIETSIAAAADMAALQAIKIDGVTEAGDNIWPENPDPAI